MVERSKLTRSRLGGRDFLNKDVLDNAEMGVLYPSSALGRSRGVYDRIVTEVA